MSNPTARTTAPAPQASPEKLRPYQIIAQTFDAAFERIEALEAAAAKRSTRAILSHRIEADGRLVLILPGGAEEVVGYVTKGATS